MGDFTLSGEFHLEAVFDIVVLFDHALGPVDFTLVLVIGQFMVAFDHKEDRVFAFLVLGNDFFSFLDFSDFEGIDDLFNIFFLEITEDVASFQSFVSVVSQDDD